MRMHYSNDKLPYLQVSMKPPACCISSKKRKMSQLAFPESEVRDV